MDLDDICTSCCEDSPEDECPESKRPCGHHCNHSWNQDQCCWCDKEFGEEETKKPDVVIIGVGNLHINPEMMKKIHDSFDGVIIDPDSIGVDIGCGLVVKPDDPMLTAIDSIPYHNDHNMEDMEDLMIGVKNKEIAHKKNLAQMGRDQFKKKNRRKF